MPSCCPVSARSVRCVDALAASGLGDVARSVIAEGRPFLGICVGMQLLYDSSDEAPEPSRPRGVRPQDPPPGGRREAPADAVEPAGPRARRSGAPDVRRGRRPVGLLRAQLRGRGRAGGGGDVRLRRPGDRSSGRATTCGPPSSTPRSPRRRDWRSWPTSCAGRAERCRHELRPVPGHRPAGRTLRAPVPGRLRPGDALRRRPRRSGPGVRRGGCAVDPRGRPGRCSLGGGDQPRRHRRDLRGGRRARAVGRRRPHRRRSRCARRTPEWHGW